MLLENALADFIGLVFKQEAHQHLLTKNTLTEVHYDNYFYALTRALKNHYPMTMQLLGERFFELLCNEYIHSYPSLSPQLNDYGTYFATFLSHHEKLKSYPYVADMARFEWACHKLPILDSMFTLSETLSQLNDADIDKIYLEINPTIQLFHSVFPIDKLIDYCKTTNESPFEMTTEPCYLLIKRNIDGLCFITLKAVEYTFLHDLSHNISLAMTLEHALSFDSTFRLDEQLSKWITAKVIQKIEVIE